MRYFNLIALSALIVLVGLCSAGSASPVVIPDNYQGAVTPSDYSDVVGYGYYFDVDRMEISFSSGNLIVDIYTRYLNNIGQYQTQLGDLFISTDGWNPEGLSPYKTDNASNGEDWEYALVTDYKVGQASGDAYLYDTEFGTIISSYAPSGYTYRKGQEATFTPNDNSVGVGTWAIYNNFASPDTDDYLRYTISMNALGNPASLGFHWTMTCGNDVIEGGTQHTPEPSTVLLLGAGLFGIGVFARRKISR